jgi:hypothetical protein
LQECLPLAGALILHRHRQGFTCSNENSEVFGSRQAGVYEVPEEHLKMLGENRNDDRPEITALRFVDGYGVGEIQFRDVIAFIVNRPPIRKKQDHTCQFLVIDFLKDPDVAVEHSQIVIVPPMNDPVTNTEDSLTYLQLTFSLLRRIGTFLDHSVHAQSVQTTPGHGGDDLDFNRIPEIYRYPLMIELSDYIDS